MKWKPVLDENGQTEAEFLKNYHPRDYERPSVTVDMLLFAMEEIPGNKKSLPDQEMKILLIRRKNHPFADCFAIPGGFVDINENLEEAAKRELMEETHIENVYLEQLYTWGDVDRDPRMRVISVSYLALVQKNSCLEKAGDDAKEALWFVVTKTKKCEISETESIWELKLENKEKNIVIVYDIKETIRKNGVLDLVQAETELSQESEYRLAFDHGKIVNMAVDRIRNKAEYTQILFNLLPEEFTLSAAQKVYEAMLGRKVSKPGFRKKFAPFVEECDKCEENVGYRPSRYYRYKGGKNGENTDRS